MQHKLRALDLIAQGYVLANETPECLIFAKGQERALLYKDSDKEIVYRIRSN